MYAANYISCTFYYKIKRTGWQILLYNYKLAKIKELDLATGYICNFI